ncbi:core histone H2A/H2B/H3/H4 [Ostertagia ostertagi]
MFLMIRKSENQKEIAAIDDLSKLPKDEEEGNKDIVDAAIRVVEVLKKNKYRAKVSKKNRLAFPKMKFYRCLRRMTRLRVADAASVFMAAIVRYLVEEVFSLAHDCMVRQKRKRITPQHIGMGVRIDDELKNRQRDAMLAGRPVQTVIEEVEPLMQRSASRISCVRELPDFQSLDKLRPKRDESGEKIEPPNFNTMTAENNQSSTQLVFYQFSSAS